MSIVSLGYSVLSPLLCHRYLAVAAGLVLLPLLAHAEAQQLPVEGGVITSRVGWRPDPFGSGKQLFHRGIDIAVPVGTPVRAVRAGRTVVAGDHGAYGVAVILEHNDGSRTLYGHNALVRVQPGQLVEAGTVIALSGNSGRSTGPHVHFEEQPASGPTRIRLAQEDVHTSTPTIAQQEQTRQLQRMEAAISSLLNSINRPAVPIVGQGGPQ